MPAYDFKCKQCSLTVEIVRPASDSSPVLCRTCGAEMKQVFHPVGVHFKGSGFHNTDYKRPSAGSAPVPDAPSCPAAGGPACGGCPASGSE